MLSSFIKNLSILKKFLFINLLVFVIFGSLTIVYLIGIQPNLIHKKTLNHIQIIDNTIEHIRMLRIQFNEDDIKKFLFSTRFLFQNLDRVLIFDSDFNLIGDTDTLDLDPRSFSQRLEIVEMDILSDDIKSEEKEIINKAIKTLIKLKIKVTGPIAPDSSFMIFKKYKFDVIIGMYHDQVLTPFKALYNFKAINITLGLPYIRISPDHGVAENITGKKIANPRSLIESIKFFNYIN